MESPYRIRWNRLSTCPCYVPNDVHHIVGHIGTARDFFFTDMDNHMIGGDYRQTVDPVILAYSLVNCAVNQPPMHILPS